MGYSAEYDGSMRLTRISTGNAIGGEPGRSEGRPRVICLPPFRAFGARVKYVIKSTFTAPCQDGQFHFAYARLADNVGNNFLSNTWRVPIENEAGDAGSISP